MPTKGVRNIKKYIIIINFIIIYFMNLPSFDKNEGGFFYGFKYLFIF